MDNSFQKWAKLYLRACKNVVHVESRGNWVEVTDAEGSGHLALTVAGVYMIAEELDVEVS